VISPSQRPLPDNTQHSQQTNIHAPGGIRTCNPSRRSAADPRLRPLGHWDRLRPYLRQKNKTYGILVNFAHFHPCNLSIVSFIATSINKPSFSIRRPTYSVSLTLQLHSYVIISNSFSFSTSLKMADKGRNTYKNTYMIIYYCAPLFYSFWNKCCKLLSPHRTRTILNPSEAF
jgi:hypothetical protein